MPFHSFSTIDDHATSRPRATACLCTLPAHARLLTFEYTGVVNWIYEQHPVTGFSRTLAASDLAPSTIAVGERFHGRFSYDSDMPVRTAQAPVWTHYQGGADLPLASFLRFDSGLQATSALAAPSITIEDDKPGNAYEGFAYHAAPSGAADKFSIILSDHSRTVFSDTALPSALSLDWFEHANAHHQYRNDNMDMTLWVQGSLLSLREVSPVPEPASHMLVLLGGGILAGLARRRAPRA